MDGGEEGGQTEVEQRRGEGQRGEEEVRWGRRRPGVEIAQSGCRGWSRSEIDHLREQSVINGSPQIRGLWPYLGMC